MQFGGNIIGKNLSAFVQTYPTPDSRVVQWRRQLFMSGEAKFDYPPFCHGVAEINLTLARDRQLLHKSTELEAYSYYYFDRVKKCSR